MREGFYRTLATHRHRHRHRHGYTHTHTHTHTRTHAHTHTNTHTHSRTRAHTHTHGHTRTHTHTHTLSPPTHTQPVQINAVHTKIEKNVWSEISTGVYEVSEAIMTKQYSTIYLLAMCNELQVNENKINVVMKANTDREGMKEKALFM